jgi:hypothetical protein
MVFEHRANRVLVTARACFLQSIIGGKDFDTRAKLLGTRGKIFANDNGARVEGFARA